MSVKIKKGLIQDGAIAFIIQAHKCLIPLTGDNPTLRDNKQTMFILIENPLNCSVALFLYMTNCFMLPL